ncbi:MAG: hypothetical protein IJ735_06340 [Clostridia bacterium]|nr:hypothetical protein [Clostridia bacterium]
MKLNGKRVFLCLMIMLVAVFSCVTFVACNVDDVKEITVTPDAINVRIGEFKYADYTVTATYGSGRTEESVLTEDMIAPKDRLKFFLEGEHDIDVTFLRTTTTIKVNVRRNVFAGAEFNDLDVVYNGEFYTVEVKNVPEGTTVTYPTTNRFRTAGEYQATAILRKDAYEMKEMTAKVTIRKADYDLSEVTFEDRSIEYDGTAHILEMAGTMPTGLYVDYTITREGGREEKGNSATNAGRYTVEAKFSGDSVNYNEVEPKQAVLTIRQATIDVSGLTFEDKTVVYDRTQQSVVVEGTLPRGVNVTYRNNEHVDAGTYEATAVFSVDDTVNYAAIDPMKAKLVIEKADYDMSAVHFNGTKVTYDGTEKKIEVQGQLPTGISVSYEGNEGTDAGTYEATATFTSHNVNYNDPKSMTATLIIDPAVAQMDQIVFERRRFISLVRDKNNEYDEDSDYDPYLVANEYRPSNVPVGFAMTVEYKKTNDWQADLANEMEEGPYIREITEDGYYVVKVTFDGGKNYSDDKPTVKTVIRVDTIDNDDISTWEQLVFDDLWVNPETGNTTGVFMDYYTGSCVDTEQRKSVIFGDVTLEYCDCNVLLAYDLENDTVDIDALLADAINDRYIPEAKLNDYKNLAASYAAFTGSEQFQKLLTAAETASGGPLEDDPTYSFDIDKAAYVSLDDSGSLISNYAGKTLSEYQEKLATLFGFASKADFLEAVEGVFGTYFDDDFRLDAHVSDNPLACEGAVYAAIGTEGDFAFIFPYVMYFSDVNSEFIFLFCGKIGGVQRYGALLSDSEDFFDFFDGPDVRRSPFPLEGRCKTAELWMTEDGMVFRLSKKTKVVVENGVNVEKPITNGKDFIFVKQNDSTERLIYGNVEIYRFITELPGSCAETSEGYDADEYKIETDTTVYSFCDDDVFATVIKADGDATGITRRDAREDHPQMTSDVAEKFDELSRLYQDFLSNYVTGEDVVNEWKIGVSNRNYAAYKAFFEYAAEMMAKSNRNMGKQSEYVLSKSVIIGINRAFSIAINSSGYNYTVDQYRLMVAKLFGFTDLDTFTTYTTALANALVSNRKNANVDSVSARLLYDGAVLAENGTYVLPYAIKSEASVNKVTVFLFVDKNGVASIWINDAKNAFNATDFGDTAWETSDKYTVTVYGRCLMFEDDGYIMNEDLSKNVVEMIDKLQQYPEYVFTVGGAKENCNKTDVNADYYTHLHNLDERCSETNYKKMVGNVDGYVTIESDECNPFCMINYGSDWVFDDIDALKEHSLYSAPKSVIDAFDSLSELFAAFMDSKTINDYTVFFNVSVALYNNSIPAFANNVDSDRTRSAVIGLNHPFKMLFGDEPTSQIDYIELVANLFGFSEGDDYGLDIDAFKDYVERLVDLYADYRAGIVTNKALENGCFHTKNGSFVFPIAIENELPSTVLAYLILDADGRLSIWLNDIDAALWATSYDADHLPDDDFSLRNELYCKNMLFAKEIPYEAMFMYCDDDPIMTVQKENGDASAITKRVDRNDVGTITDEIADKFDALSALYADLFSRYDLDAENTNWAITVGGDNYAEYRRLFRYARDLFAAANNNLGKVDEYMLSGSAIIGMNEAFAISFAGNDYSLEEYRLMLAKLFGFTDANVFEKCADALAKALAENEAGAGVDSIADRLLYDGAVRTANGTFVLPYAIKNDTSKKVVLAFVFVDEDGTMAVWINNVNDAFAATEFTVVDGDETPDFIYVSGRCVLFENNDYVGWNANGMAKYVAVEKAKAFASEGDFLIYSPFTDEEGFEVYWFSVYGFETEVVYEDSDSDNIGTVNKGFYTMINVAGIEDVHLYNQYVIETYENYASYDLDDDGDEGEGE